MSDTKRESFVAPVERQTLGQRIYESLRVAIIRGDLSPGQRVTEREIAKQMNVSTTPVREAFRRLSVEGLITIVPWSGAVIEGVSEKDIVEVYQCREVLEGLACGLAAQNINDKGLARLEVLVEQSKVESDAKEISRLNSEIHDVIFEYAGNSRLVSMINSLNDVVLIHREITAVDLLRTTNIYKEHCDILTALQNHNRQDAELAMRRHVRNGLDFFRKHSEI